MSINQTMKVALETFNKKYDIIINSESDTHVRFGMKKIDVGIYIGRGEINLFVFKKDTNFEENKFYSIHNLCDYANWKSTKRFDEFDINIPIDFVIDYFVENYRHLIEKGDYNWIDNFETFLLNRHKWREKC